MPAPSPRRSRAALLLTTFVGGGLFLLAGCYPGAGGGHGGTTTTSSSTTSSTLSPAECLTLRNAVLSDESAIAGLEAAIQNAPPGSDTSATQAQLVQFQGKLAVDQQALDDSGCPPT